MRDRSPTRADGTVPVQFAARLSGFVAHLRLNGFHAGLGETRSALEIAALYGLDSGAAFRQRLKILFCGSRQDWHRFDALFEAFWFARGRKRLGKAKAPEQHRPQPVQSPLWREHLGGAGAAEAPASEAPGTAASDSAPTGRLIAAPTELKQYSDLRRFADPAQMAAAEALALRLARAIRYRLSRRYRIQRRGAKIDFRRTLRRNMRYGGLALQLVRKAPPDRPVRLVVLLDVSGSMMQYSRFFLQFVKGLVGQWLEAEAFLFHTRLLRVTDALRENDAVQAMTRVALLAEGFGGGTRLGESLASFNRYYARRSLNSRSVVMIVSDGYDTGDSAQLDRELAQLKRRARRLVWLNPLLGGRDYEPSNRAMRTALPYIDCFAPANTLASLAAVEAELARL